MTAGLTLLPARCSKEVLLLIPTGWYSTPSSVAAEDLGRRRVKQGLPTLGPAEGRGADRARLALAQRRAQGAATTRRWTDVCRRRRLWSAEAPKFPAVEIDHVGLR